MASRCKVVEKALEGDDSDCDGRKIEGRVLEAETLRKVEERLIMEYAVVEGGLVVFEYIQGEWFVREECLPRTEQYMYS